MLRRRSGRLWVVPVVLVAAIGLYFFPPIYDRLAWRVDDARTRLKYFFNPPAEAAFLPTQQAAIEAIVSATMQAHATEQAAAGTPSATSTRIGPAATPTITVTPLPGEVILPGVVYIDQTGGYNLCAPSNLAMALKFWHWKGSRDEIIRVVKPGENNPSKDYIERGKADLNVMPYELVDFVNNHTEFHALQRLGGDLQVIKTLVASGFPPVVEKGINELDTTNRTSWMGHYLFITGYDDAAQELIVQDAYHKGANYHLPYVVLEQDWLSFDRLFYVVYPAERESEVLAALGPYSDSEWANRRALEMAINDTRSLADVPLFFAWFARGTSLVALQRYVDAANAYDQAFSVYATLDPDYSTRPWRMMWYQTGPYWAYYYAGRYQDVVSLANFTLDETSGRPSLEESLYWRGLAEYALGNTAGGIEDVRRSVYYNKNFAAGIAKLQEWGVIP
jgi:hypothetical protein